MTVEQMEKDFLNPSAAFRAKPFWAWNAGLDSNELRRQIRIFKQMGFGGYFMHSRVGLNTPYLSEEWFQRVGDCIDEGGKTAMEAWLYDEDRWPSGIAGGLVTKDPKYRAHFLAMARHEVPERYNWPTEPTTYVYGVTFEDDQITWYKKLDQPADILILPQNSEIVEFVLKTPPESSWWNDTTYLDTLSREAVGKFIEVTHEAYKRHFADHFGKRVPGIFTDEPNGGAAMRDMWGSGVSLPWTAGFAERFEQWFGYDLVQRLPEVFFETEGKAFNRVRYHYFCTRSRLFAENFMKQIGDWCEKNHLMFTGHVLEEEPLTNAVSVIGSIMQCYPYMQAPGIDILTQYHVDCITAKQCSSVARQTGRKWVLSEMYGCTGWETTFETYKHSGDWQAAMGITMRCPHLSWYSMAGEAKRDYPASIHFQSPWWKQYRHVEDYFSRLNVILTAGEAVCDLAVVHPIESWYLYHGPNWPTDPRLKKMEQEFPALVKHVLGSHLDFDFVDEHLLTEFTAKVNHDAAGPMLQVGQARYRAVLVPPMVTMRKATLELLKSFALEGGTVVFAGSAPELVDAETSPEAQDFARDKTPSDFVAAIETKARRVSIRDGQGLEAADVLYQFRKIGDDWAIFMVNTNRKSGLNPLTVRLNLDLPKGGQIQLWDAASGQKYKLTGEITYRTATFKIDIPASGSRLVVIAAQPQTLDTAPVLKAGVTKVTLGEEGWSMLLDDYNVIVLDRADCTGQSDGRKKFSRTKTEILQLDCALREYLELPHRGGSMVQPWVDAGRPLGPTAQVTLTYKFGVKVLPTGPILLGLEQPERWQIKINDQPLDTDMVNGWWVDPAIKTLAIDPAMLTRGKNILTLEGQFDRHANLEIIYLLGSFGAETDGKSGSIVKLPSKIDLGSWLDQGLPFYSGNVVYRTGFEFQPEAGKRYLLSLSEFKATAVELSINGKPSVPLCWPEYHFDCTDLLTPGRNTVDIKLLGSRHNAFGPLHLAVDNPEWTGPSQFHTNPEDPGVWQDEYKLLPYGLMAPPVLAECEV